MAGLAVRETVTLAGRAERARLARAFVGGVSPDGVPGLRGFGVSLNGEDGDVLRAYRDDVHGYSDHFFQTELAEFFAARGFHFYALDLRKSGPGRWRPPRRTE
jgi:hypothetical protein